MNNKKIGNQKEGKILLTRDGFPVLQQAIIYGKVAEAIEYQSEYVEHYENIVSVME